MSDPRYVAAKAIDAPYWIFSPSATPSTVSFGPRFELAFTRAEFFAFLATLPDSAIPAPPPLPPPTPEPPLFALEWRIVTTDLLNVRKAPNGAVVGTLKKGEVVQINEGQKAGAYTWRKIVGKEWWIAQELTASTAEPNVKRWTTSIINIRPEPGTNNTPVGFLPKGTEVTLFAQTVKRDAYTWARLADGRGYIALEFTEDKAPVVEAPPAPKPEPPPTIPKPAAQLGFNLIGPGAFNVLSQFPEQLGTCTVISEPKACLNLSSDWVNYRDKSDGAGRQEPDPYDWLGRQWTAPAWFERCWPKLSLAVREPGREIMYTFKNEVFRRGAIDWWIAFDKALIDMCAARGITCTYGNFSVGSFVPADVPKLKGLVEYGAAKGMVLSANTYEFPDHPHLLGYLVPLLEAVPYAPFLLNEVGSAPNDARYPGREGMVSILRRAYTLYGHFAGCLGLILWGLKGSTTDWEHSNIPESDFPFLLQAVKTL